MTAAVSIPVSEYLQTSYRPDCDYVDGELLRRNVGTQPHSVLQLLIAKWFDNHFETYGWVGSTEQRVQVTPTRFRIPDACALIEGAGEEVILSPPLVCVEVLSPDDRLPDVMERLTDFFTMGVPNIWLLDPVLHLVWTISPDGALQPFRGSMLPVTGSGESLDLPQLFEALRRRLARERL